MRASVRACLCVCVCVRVCTRACVYPCVRLSVCACESVSVCSRDCARARMCILPVAVGACTRASGSSSAHRIRARDRAGPSDRHGPVGHVHCAAVSVLHAPPVRCGPPPPTGRPSPRAAPAHGPPSAGPRGRTFVRVSEIATRSNTSVPFSTYTAPPDPCTRAAAAEISIRPSPAAVTAARLHRPPVCRGRRHAKAAPCASPRGRAAAMVSEIATPSNTSVPLDTYTAPPECPCARGCRCDQYMAEPGVARTRRLALRPSPHGACACRHTGARMRACVGACE
jgi:hypothetical protein